MQAKYSDQLKHLLLDMISTSRTVGRERIEALEGPDWAALCEMARQHRLEPILHHHQQTTIGNHWIVPDAVTARWRASYRRSALKALEVQRALVRVSRILDQANIPYAALKGSWLINNAYSHPALRPMRDIDILVDFDDAILAYELIQKSGYERAADDTRPLTYYLENTRDMPVLYEATTGIKFEIHFRVTDDHKNRTDPVFSDSQALLDMRTAAFADKFGLSYLNPTYGLLHLIVHCAYDHQFNNGPLILHDIACFVENADIDWEQFWRLVDLGDWRNGCELIFALTAHYHVESRSKLASSGNTNIPQNVLDAASLLMLQNFPERATIAFRVEMEALGSHWQRLLSLLHRIFPSRHVLAPLVNVDPEGRLFWLGYPIWLFKRTRQYLFRKIAPDLNSDIHHAVIVDRWLNPTT
jgi:Uncharacterised nucleotidyltransferase